MKDDFTTNSHYLIYTFLFRKVGRMYFVNLGVKGLRMAMGLCVVRCWSVIMLVITKSQESDLLITSMITDQHQMTRSPITN